MQGRLPLPMAQGAEHTLDESITVKVADGQLNPEENDDQKTINNFYHAHGNQFSKMFNSKMVILTSSETNNHSNNVDFVTKIIHLRSE